MLHQSRLAINFRRLLASTQKHVENKARRRDGRLREPSDAVDVALDKFLETLNRYHNELTTLSKETRPSEQSAQFLADSKHQLDELAVRITKLESENPPAASHPLEADSVESFILSDSNEPPPQDDTPAQPTAEDSPSAIASATAPTAVVEPPAPAASAATATLPGPVRRRGPNRKTLPQGVLAEELLKHHETRHEQLTDEMVSYAQQLKKKALETNDIVAKSVQNLGKLEQEVDDNLAVTKLANEAMADLFKSTSGSTWYYWSILMIATLMFVGVYLFMKVFPKVPS